MVNARMGRHKFLGAQGSCWYGTSQLWAPWQALMSLPQPVDVERWPNSLLPGNARNTPTSLQHTLSSQLPWRPWAQWTTLHTISSKTLAARSVKYLVTAEKDRLFSSGCRSQSNVLTRSCSTSRSLGTTIHSTFAFNLFFVFNPRTYTTGVFKNNNNNSSAVSLAIGKGKGKRWFV